MGASLNDIFGTNAAIEPATPESYGVRPPAFRLPIETRIRAVSLQVSDLARSRAFYEQTLGFRALRVSEGRVSLGAISGDAVLIELVERRGGQRRTQKKSLGLYHIAILLPTRGDLGRFLRHLHDTGARAGAGDHLVSEALYLQDPDDLGIEVYADRPRDTWQKRNRELVMATDPVDMRSLVAAGGGEPWAGMPAGTIIGHVHLHVGDLEAASRFYSSAVGFDRMVWSYPSALFLAAGGYHHHLGTNTWAGPDAEPATADEPQLLEWVLELPTRQDVLAAESSLRDGGYPTEIVDGGASVLTRDPWGTTLRIAARSDAAER
jgi:catechol 2,3-dioxygenase